MIKFTGVGVVNSFCTSLYQHPTSQISTRNAILVQGTLTHRLRHGMLCLSVLGCLGYFVIPSLSGVGVMKCCWDGVGWGRGTLPSLLLCMCFFCMRYVVHHVRQVPLRWLFDSRTLVSHKLRYKRNMAGKYSTTYPLCQVVSFWI
jgi:hypothetical protein